MKDKFNNKNGTLTRYAFACGYVEQKINGNARKTLSLDCIWHIKGFDKSGKHFWECFDNLTQARQFYRSISI